MTNLIKRAMLGDRKAQEEITARGELLPCPFCGDKIQQRKAITGIQAFVCDNPSCGACVTFAGIKKISQGVTEAGKPLRNFNHRPPLVVQGKWIDVIRLCECSICRYQVNNGLFKSNLNYCPNCGAKMNEED